MFSQNSISSGDKTELHYSKIIYHIKEKIYILLHFEYSIYNNLDAFLLFILDNFYTLK